MIEIISSKVSLPCGEVSVMNQSNGTWNFEQRMPNGPLNELIHLLVLLACEWMFECQLLN